ncbi:MAG: dCTP deaminase [Chitinophagales bacterium]|nr:dCTP deaminase [Chitinophagales bacterium]
MSRIIREAAWPYLEAQLDLVRQFSRLSTLATHQKLCIAISEYLQSEYNAIRDQLQYSVFLENLLAVGALVSLLRKTVKQEPYWCLPLIQDCYKKLGIDCKEREILIAESKFHFNYHVKVNLVLHYRIADFYYEAHNEGAVTKSDPKPIDLFTIPYEMKNDLASFSLLCHEVAHVYLNQKSQQLRELVKVRFSEEDDDHLNIMASHVEEYICDQIARDVFGPTFDLALILFMSLKGMNKHWESSLTHPPEAVRMRESWHNLENYSSSSEACQQALDILREDYFNSSPDWSFNSDDIKKDFVGYEPLTSVSHDLYKWLYPKIGLSRPQITPELLGNWWEQICPVLDEMLPPVEAINGEYPIRFTPIQAQIVTTLYFFNVEHRKAKNEFFKGESSNDLIKFRQKLTGLLRYAISIYNFVQHADKQRGASDRKIISNLSAARSTLWAKRKTLKIVPTTSILKQYSSHGVDLRLGMTFITGKLSDLTHISQNTIAKHKSSATQPHYLERFFDYHTVPVGKSFTLHPHSFVLAATLEYVSIPEEYYALVLGRSSWGRLGLNIATATAVGAGFKGCITLELRNLGEIPLQLNVGTRICQIALIPIPSTDAKQQYSQGANKYLYPVEAEIPNLEQDDDLTLLQNM